MAMTTSSSISVNPRKRRTLSKTCIYTQDGSPGKTEPGKSIPDSQKLGKAPSRTWPDENHRRIYLNMGGLWPPVAKGRLERKTRRGQA